MNIETILWDFDGVILDSNAVRDEGFALTLSNYPEKEVAALLQYHRKNGGLSRYHKFRYFFEKIREEEVTENRIMELAQQFSVFMLQKLGKAELLIEDTMIFIKGNYKQYNMHIVSGSDQKELRMLCYQLKIASYFKSIHGSPTPKNKLVSEILANNQYDPKRCLLIGDSINDLDAAKHVNIAFLGYNNPILNKGERNYIHSFSSDQHLILGREKS